MKNMISANLRRLRQLYKLTQEEVADKIGVTRQAVAKWETGESVPDIINCSALAKLYNVTVDNLINFDESDAGVPIPPKGKHIFGIVKIGERGQIVIPKKAREIFNLAPGDELLVLGDESPGRSGIAIVKAKNFLEFNLRLKEAELYEE